MSCTVDQVSCAYVYDSDKEQMYEYRMQLKYVLVNSAEWSYFLEVFDVTENSIHYLNVTSLYKLNKYTSSSFYSKELDSLDNIVGCWLEVEHEVLESITNNAIFTGHTVFKLKKSYTQGIIIPFIRHVKIFEYVSNDYDKIKFIQVNGGYTFTTINNKSYVLLETRIFEGLNYEY